MKTPPAPGGPVIVHRTTDTGHVASFALTAANFDPDVIRLMPDMVRRPLRGYRLVLPRIPRSPRALGFEVARASDGQCLTRNIAMVVTTEPMVIELTTTIVSPMPADEAYIIADLEQLQGRRMRR
jgi:hypothetical protein